MLRGIFDAQGKVGLTALPMLLQDLFLPSWNAPVKKYEAQKCVEPPNESPPLQNTRLSKHRESFNNFDDALLLKIFSHLPLVDLARASQVCQRWYRISFDEVLWRKVDLRRFAKLLSDEDAFERFAKSRLSTKVYSLDLTGLVLTEKNMNAIAVHCKNLRSLTLKCVTFKSSNSKPGIDDTEIRPIIPKQLQWLDIRFSRGTSSVFSSIASQLRHVKSLGVCDGFLQTLTVSAKLESTIASLTNSLEILDLSQCLFATDSLLELFGRCKNLKVLSLRKCSGVSGNSLQMFLQNCSHLETLILDGTSIGNVALENVQWEKSLLKHLELGWCPLVTSASLEKSLPQIAQIPTLQYLGLCDVGQGKALTDDVFTSFAANLTAEGPLARVNIGSSHGVTKEILDRFKKCYLNMSEPRAPRCVTPCEVVASQDSIKSGALERNLIPNRAVMFCFPAAKFPLQSFALETPL